MLTSAAIEFAWPTLYEDFEWVHAHPVRSDWTIEKAVAQVLVPRGIPVTGLSPLKHYVHFPLQHSTGLFREFAALSFDPAALELFAFEYGPLTLGRLFVPVGLKAKFPKPPKTTSVIPLDGKIREGHSLSIPEWETKWRELGAISGDSWDDWAWNVNMMRSLVNVWDAVASKDRATLEGFIHAITGDKSGKTTMQLNADDTLVPVEWTADKPVPMSQLLAVAEHLLLGLVEAQFDSGLSVGLRTRTPKHHGRLILQPRSLRDALWVQFGLAVIERKTFRSCEACGKTFEVSPQFARVNRTLCSPACKARAHRKRRQEALKLADRGLKPRAIAKSVGSQVSTVTNWLKESKDAQKTPRKR